jgi:hypothetical protein
LNVGVPPDDETTAINYITLLRQNQFDRIVSELDPKLKDPLARDKLAKMSQQVPAGEPESVKVVRYDINNAPAYRAFNITFEYQFPGKWLLMNVSVRKEGGVSAITALRVLPVSDSLENANQFTFSGKGVRQYGIFAMACAVPLFILSALIVCCRTKMLKGKWLWLIFIIFGIGSMTVNWTTGQLSLLPAIYPAIPTQAHILAYFFPQLFGAGLFGYAYGPWMISVSFPLGAIVFFLMRKSPAAESPPSSRGGAKDRGR